jgi:DNA (cytosine-5)-methyltransferase 1
VKTIKAADLFCGAGGASTGLVRACQALGVDLELLAINHWPIAVETHSANHPKVRHLCESVERVDPRVAVPGGRLHLLMAGPECTHFSTARGGRPVNPQSRASAWHILKWAQELYIDTILIENVPEFRTWGPIGANSKPLQSKKGETYRAFLVALRSLGYTVEDRILNAADYGDPTTRQRLFIMARRGRHKVGWPDPTHSRTGSPTLYRRTKRWKAAREVIDWSVQGKSIFSRKKPLKPATMARILAGLRKFGGPELKPFLVLMEHGGRIRSLDEPLPTITTAKGGAFGVASPFLVPMYGERPTQGPRTHSVDDPVPTIPATGGGKFGVVEPFVLGQQSGSVPRAVSSPLPTVATDGAIAMVEPFIVQTSERRDERVQGVDEPLRTITAMGGRCFGLAQPFILDAAHGSDGSNDNCRAKPIDDPLGVVTGSNRFALAEPFLTKYNRTATGAYSVDEPVDTISTRDRFGLVQPVVDGYVLDIHFRMLQPHELAAAMSFPKSYVFAGNREDTVKQIGNSWPGELARALCLEVVGDYATGHKADVWRKARIA